MCVRRLLLSCVDFIKYLLHLRNACKYSVSKFGSIIQAFHLSLDPYVCSSMIFRLHWVLIVVIKLLVSRVLVSSANVTLAL